MDESENTPDVVTQTTITLPYLDDEVPALYLADGRPYIPAFAVCHALGIRADTHIRRWRTLLLWETAQKLPFQTPRHGKRLVWCLLISEVPFLYSLFDWKLVSPERRAQLHEACKAHRHLVGLAYQDMQQRYKSLRQTLFSFLTTFADVDALLQQYVDTLLPMLDDGSALMLESLLEQGRTLFQEGNTLARTILQEQQSLPIVDAMKIDENNTVIDTFPMPLFPLVPHEQSERFYAVMGELTAWQQAFQTFWQSQGGKPINKKDGGHL